LILKHNLIQEEKMDILKQISTQIAALDSGQKWRVSAQDLWISHADFHSVSIYIVREAEKGQFSVSIPAALSSSVGSTAVTITKY
jgi:hypothetical protein